MSTQDEFSAAEKAAMKARAKEPKAEARAARNQRYTGCHQPCLLGTRSTREPSTYAGSPR